MYDYKYNSVAPKVTHSFASAAVVATYTVMRSSDVYALKASIQTSPTTTATVVSFYAQPVVGNGVSGAVLLGTLTLPIGTAIGKVVSKNIKPYSVAEGSEIVVSVTTASAAGAGTVYCIFGEDPESDANSANVVISA